MTLHTGKFVAESAVPANQATGLASPPALRSLRLRPILLSAAGLAALAAVGAYGHEYWTTGRFLVSTDDAYVQADNTIVAPKVAGYIAKVLVRDNQPVKAGQKLAEIDDRDFRVALDAARADVAAALATIQSKRAMLSAQGSVIAATEATLAVDRANLGFAGDEDKRYATLAASGYGTVKNAQAAAANIAAARAALARDQATAEAARGQLDVLKAAVADAQSQYERAEAVRAQAELNLSYTTIVAPVDGIVGARSLRVGQYVQAGTQLMAVVPAASAYIVANYKETQLSGVKAGQKAEVEIDAYPGRVFHGHVDSLAPASGQEFALLPPDNATGNFTKVVQRIPVKILLDGESADVLRPGMSVTPSIDLRSGPAVATR